jgi:hypothetical protein
VTKAQPCDICRRSHRPESKMFGFHLGGRAPEDVAEGLAKPRADTASGRLADRIERSGRVRARMARAGRGAAVPPGSAVPPANREH